MKHLFSFLILSILILSCQKSGSGDNSKPTSNPATDTSENFVTNINFSNSPIDITPYYSNTMLSIVWEKSPQVGTVYHYSFGTSPGRSDLQSWTKTSHNSTTIRELTSLDNKKIYFNLKSEFAGTETPIITEYFHNKFFKGYEWLWGEISIPESSKNLIGHTMIWTGKEVIIWGGSNSITGKINEGISYNPASKTLKSISKINAPSPRSHHSAVWTGSEMIIWGGSGNDSFHSNGASYNPVTNTWKSIASLPNNIMGRTLHTAVLNNNVMEISGGIESGNTFTTSKLNYHVLNDSWLVISGVLGRTGHTSVVTNIGSFIWGGNDKLGIANDNPYPIVQHRYNHTAIWTGENVIVWGGRNNTHKFRDGGIFNPSANTWTLTSDGPSQRDGHTSVWNGSEMIVWGGSSIPTPINGKYVEVYLNTGSAYNAVTKRWRTVSVTGAPDPRAGHKAVWTGLEMIIWGGNSDNSSGRYFISNSSGQCGGPGENCYGDSMAAQHSRAVGLAYTPKGKELVYTINENGVFLWKDSLSNRVLSPDGSDNWHKDTKVGAANTFLNIKSRDCTSNACFYKD